MASTAASTCQLRGRSEGALARDAGQMVGLGMERPHLQATPFPFIQHCILSHFTFQPLESVLQAQKGSGKPSNTLASSSCSPGLASLPASTSRGR